MPVGHSETFLALFNTLILRCLVKFNIIIIIIIIIKKIYYANWHQHISIQAYHSVGSENAETTCRLHRHTKRETRTAHETYTDIKNTLHTQNLAKIQP